MSQLLDPSLPIHSDCKSVVNRITDTLSPFSKAMGQHAKGIFLESLATVRKYVRRPIYWTKGHPERKCRDRSKWSYNDWGIFLADAVAEGDTHTLDSIFGVGNYDYAECPLDACIDSLLSDQLWHWRHANNNTIVFDNIIDLIHQERLKQYLATRDGYRT
jgi:hypothetical protein